MEPPGPEHRRNSAFFAPQAGRALAGPAFAKTFVANGIGPRGTRLRVSTSKPAHAIIGYVPWMQPATTFGALLILLLAWLLPRRRMDT
jgi:uncharacterized protein (TIGR03382 family)